MKKQTSLIPPKRLVQVFSVIYIIGLVAIVALSFTISFHTQKHLAIQSEVPEDLAHLIPLIIDIAIVILSMVVVINKLTKRPNFSARLMFCIFTCLSFVFNIYLSSKDFVDPHDDKFFVELLEINWLIIVLIHSVGPLALFAMTEILMRSMEGLLTQNSDQPSPETAPISPEPPTDNGGSTNGSEPVDPDDTQDGHPTNGLPTDLPNPLDEYANPRTQANIRERQTEVAELRAECDTAREIFDLIGKKYGVSYRTIQRDLDDINRRELIAPMLEAGLDANEILEKIADTFPSVTLDTIQKDITLLSNPTNQPA